jgi:hypothetical protein
MHSVIEQRRKEALRILSGHVLTSQLSGVILRGPDFIGFMYRLEYRVGGHVIERSALHRTRAAALVALRRAAVAQQASLDAEQMTDEE